MAVQRIGQGQASRSGNLAGSAQMPGDKSISHRALLLGLLAEGQTRITGLLEGADVLATAAAARAFGAIVTRYADHWTVDGAGVGALLAPQAPLDFGNSGTGARLVMGIAATHDFTTTFTGDASLSSRPMARALEPLKKMGARVLTSAGGEKLPLALKGAALPVPITYDLPVASAQVKSAVLLAALNTPGRTCVIERVPTRDHTERMLQAFGADISIETDTQGTRRICINGEARLLAQDVTVPADPSSAAFPLVAALIVPGSTVTLPGVMLNETRTGLLVTLQEMGADIRIDNRRMQGGEEVGDLIVTSSRLRGVDVPPERAASMIDEYPVLAVAAAFAQGRSIFHGLHELTVKESDRLAAIHAGLIANGVAAQINGDTLIIEGMDKVPGGGLVATRHDHRIAMAFLVMGLASEAPVTVDDMSMVATSFPTFVDVMRGLGADIA